MRDTPTRYFSAVPRNLCACVSLVVVALSACHRGNQQPVDTPPLAGLATQHVVVTPTSWVPGSDSLQWVVALGGPRATALVLDSAIASALDARGLAQRWILPAQLTRTYEKNPTYATNPYVLTEDALRVQGFKSGSRYVDPLASQLRTMIALEEDARFVLLPVALRFERTDAGHGRAVVRVALVDARSTEARWVTDIRSDATTTPRAAIANAADRLTNFFALP
jgi:hypothetical protein